MLLRFGSVRFGPLFFRTPNRICVRFGQLCRTPNRTVRTVRERRTPNKCYEAGPAGKLAIYAAKNGKIPNIFDLVRALGPSGASRQGCIAASAWESMDVKQ